MKAEKNMTGLKRQKPQSYNLVQASRAHQQVLMFLYHPVFTLPYSGYITIKISKFLMKTNTGERNGSSQHMC